MPPTRRPPAPTLTRRYLTRATLARQLLLDRARCDVVEAVERLAGLQAQLARPPFVGLWTRLDGFARDALLDAVHGRRLVRATMMRATLHVVSAADYPWLRLALRPTFAAPLSWLGERVAGLDVERLVRDARALLAGRALTFDALRPLLAERDPAGDVRAMAYVVRLQLPLVQLPSAGAAWGWDAAAPFGLAAEWQAGLDVPAGDVDDAAAARTLPRRGAACAACAPRSRRCVPSSRPSATSAGASCSTCRTPRARPPTRRRPRASSPTSTTWCWRTTTARAS
jgi:hypothetical protein